MHIKAERKSVEKVRIGPFTKHLQKLSFQRWNTLKKLFNTAYAVAKHNRPFIDFHFICSIQENNGVNLGCDHRTRDTCVDFVKAISMALLNDVETHLQSVRFFSVMRNSSTDSSSIDQEAIFTEVHLSPTQLWQVLKILKMQGQMVLLLLL